MDYEEIPHKDVGARPAVPLSSHASYADFLHDAQIFVAPQQELI
jgi:hypothetical protein